MYRRLIMLSAAFASAQVAAADPPVLEPSSKWVLDYADGYCRLVRQFGGSGRETIFYLEQYEPGDTYTVQIAGPDFATQGLRQPSFRFGPEGGSVPTYRLIGSSLGKFGSGAMANEVALLPKPERERNTLSEKDLGKVEPPMDPAAAKPITWFEVLEEQRVIGRLALGSMHDPVKALNSCTEDLLTHWGIDVAAHKGRSRGVAVKGNPGDWIGAGDYPVELMRAGTQGVVHFRLDVDERGRATQCSIQQSTRPAQFDRVVCSKIARNARFEPALDSAGKPMKSFWRSTVRFELPN